MKVLWMCNIVLPQIAKEIGLPIVNTGGWLTGLLNDLIEEEIEISVCFPIANKKNVQMGRTKNLNYFGFYQNSKKITKYDYDLELFLQEILKKEKPDIIHIFGTEYPHTLAMVNACEKLGIIDRVVINIQGLISVCSRHYYANLPSKVINRYTIRDFIKKDNIKNQQNNFKKRGKFEIEAIKKVKHVIGRTDWDKACTYIINPDIKYHFCNETLRNSFYNKKWDLEKCKKHSIFLSQGNYPIKGFHLMLQALPEVLKEYPDAHVYITGNSPLNVNSIRERLKLTTYKKYIGEMIKQLKLENNITFLGNLNEYDMCNQFLNSHVFVSASVMENSPNSVGEAMILGVPTITSDVGGVKNMLRHKIDGFIYQHDAPYMLAYYIKEIFSNGKLAVEFSQNSRANASITHNKKINSDTIISIYRRIKK